MRNVSTGLWTGIAVLSLLVSVSRAEAEKVPLDQLPKAVTAAVKAKFPDGKLKNAQKEEVDGKVLFDVALNFKDHDYDVSVTPDGKIMETGKTISSRELPDKVARELTIKYPRGVNKKIVEVTQDKTVTYKVLLYTGDKRWLDLVVDPDGKVLKETERKEEKKP